MPQRGRAEALHDDEDDAPPRDDDAPLILTLRLDADAFVRLDALRRQHFPPERNHLRAHLTLFHALPGGERAAIAARLAECCAVTPALPLRASGLRSLGRGVAVEVEGEALRSLRASLAADWRGWLGAQDQQGWRPHVTVQNKASGEQARALLERLRVGFEPWSLRGEGLLLHRYLGGPWAPAGDFPFRGG